MNKTTLKTVRRIALRVRKWAEKLQKSPEASGCWDTDLCGMCAIASTRLHLRLQENGVPSEVVFGWGHAFVVIDDKFVVDITATQFPEYLGEMFPRRVPKVLIVEWKKLLMLGEYAPWHPNASFKDPINIEQFQLDEEWPEEQTVGFERCIERLTNG